MVDKMNVNANPGLRDIRSRTRGAIRMALLFSLVINMLMLTAPLYMLQVFDRVIVSRSLDTLLYLSLIAGVALLVMWVLDMVRTGIMASVGVWLERRLGGQVLETSVHAAVTSSTPSIQPIRDLGTVRGFLMGPGLFPFFDAPWTPLFLGMIFLLDPLLGWIAVAGAVVLFSLALANEILSRGSMAQSSRASFQAERMADTAARNADSLIAMGMIDGAVGRWHDSNDLALAAHRRAARLGGFITATAKSLRLALQIGIMAAGAYLVLQDQISSGAMIASSILVSRALAPIEQAIGSWRTAVAARAAWARLSQCLERAPATPSMPLPKPLGALSVEGVRFAHRGAVQPLIGGVSFSLAPGESLALVGPTGAGKSTLARLLVGSLVPQLGHVRLDGADLAGWDPHDRGTHVGYMAQDVELIDGTVRDNIARLGPVDPEAVVQAARQADVHDLILSLPQGYETQVGPLGTILSGGQRQRIGLARALYGGPSLVVLDEPNASLDQEGEAALVRTLKDLKACGTTVVVISHRPSLLHTMDKVLVLNAGRVDRFGPREEILNRFKTVAPRRAAMAEA